MRPSACPYPSGMLPAFGAPQGGNGVSSIIYIIGAVVVIIVVLKVLGLY
jgi:hypothetical protein